MFNDKSNKENTEPLLHVINNIQVSTTLKTLWILFNDYTGIDNKIPIPKKLRN